MLRNRRDGKRQRNSDNEDSNTRPTKRSKTQKTKECLIDILHDELIIQILVQIPMISFGG